MNSNKAIGGYFELEPQSNNGDNLHAGSILLNTGRNCFEYILKASRTHHVYMPRYTCSVIFEPLHKLRIPYTTYDINENLELRDIPAVGENELLLYTNYFGLKDTYCDKLASQLQQKLVLDCCQALFYSPRKDCHVFYSPRKFVGLPDGGCLYTPNKLEEEIPTDRKSEKRTSHLVIRREEGAEAGFTEFTKNEATLQNQHIKRMSGLTEKMMNSIDFERVKNKRKENFAYLSKELRDQLYIGKDDWQENACPMVFPFWGLGAGVRRMLTGERIYTATYWPNILQEFSEETLEYKLADRLIALPIDQRYNETDMSRIVEMVCEN